MRAEARSSWGRPQMAHAANGVRREGPGRGGEAVTARTAWSGPTHMMEQSTNNGGLGVTLTGVPRRERRSLKFSLGPDRLMTCKQDTIEHI
jgi:hypothetical protein